MNSLLRRKLVIGVSAVVLLGGAAGAVAATSGSGGSGRQAYLSDVATRLGVAPSALTAAMKAADIDRIEAAVAAGRLSRAKAELLKQRIQRSGVPLYGFGFGGRRGGLGRASAAAQYLGITHAALRSERRSGKSLAQIAASTPGKSVAGLQAAIIAAAKTRLAAAVSSGRITAQQEQERLSRLSGQIEAMLARTSPLRGSNGGPPTGSPGG